MKTIKSSRAIWIGILAMLMSVVMIFALAACDNTNDNKGDDGLSDGIYKVDATLDASITMGAAGPQSFAGVYKAAYITKENDEHTLTIIFQAGPLTVMGITGTIFVDDNPINKKVDTDGTIGWYKKDGTLVTDGITVTYSSGDNYAATPNKTNVYYVQSVSFKVDELRDSYDLTLFFNSNMMGMQFVKDSYPATLKLDLDSAESVTAIEGLGVETLGTVPQHEPDIVEPVTDKYTKYGSELNAVISMGQEVNFTKNLFDGVYVIKKDGKYEITLIFKAGKIDMPFGNVMDGFLTNSQCPGYRGGEPFMPVWGYYNDETLVKDVSLSYSDGEDYVTVSEGSYYYVKSLTFAVDTFEEEYILSLCVMAGNETSTSGQQFPYTSSSGTVCNATLTIDLNDAETVDSIDSLFGVETLGTVPQPEPEYTEHQVPILSLTSKAPLPQVQAAFAEAFGNNATLVVYKDGSKKLRLENKHMIINLGKNLDANVTYVEGANVISTRESVYSDATTGEPVNITVPDIIELDYSDDCNGVLELTIGVDFMASMTNKEDIIKGYSTKVTLTLDLSGLEL